MQSIIMRARALALVAALAMGGASAAQAAGGDVELTHKKWTWQGIFGGFDEAQLRRGYQVYREVCAACHAMKYIRFRNLGDLGYTPEAIQEIAEGYLVEDGPDEFGDMFERPARPSDAFPAPFPNEAAARASNGGAYPLDLSLITKARPHGPDYVYSLMLGYEEPPEGMTMMPGMYYNKAFSGGQIAMAQQLYEDLIIYEDGTPATKEQMAEDVVAFLHWAAEPNLEKRHYMGFQVVLFLIFMTALFYAWKRRVWADVH